MGLVKKSSGIGVCPPAPRRALHPVVASLAAESRGGASWVGSGRPRQTVVDERLDAPQRVVARDERLRRHCQQDLGLSGCLSAHGVPPIGTPMIAGQLFFSAPC